MFIAWREIRRSPGRFALLIGAVALLVLLLLFFQSVAGALTRGLTGGVEANAAEVFVYAESARRNPAASFLDPTLVDDLAAVDGVEAVTAAGVATFTVDDLDIVVVGLGGDPAAGGPVEVSDGRRATAVGEALFAGSSFTDSFELGRRLEIEGLEVEVVGIAPDAVFDVSPTLYVTWEQYRARGQAKAGAPVEPAVSWFGLDLADGAADGDVIAAVDAGVDGVEALTRADAATSLPGAGRISQSFSILYLLLFIVVTIVTGVFFLILTVQKQRSLVLLRAIGAARRDIVGPVVLEVLVVVGVGAVLGAGLAAGLLHLARDVFGSSLDPATTVATIGFIVALGLVASIGALRRVLSVDPLEATTAGTV